MQRIIGTVLELKKLCEKRDTHGFSIIKVLAKIKIEGKAAKNFKLPKGIKGKVYWVIRSYIHPWKMKRGDKIILNPKEVRDLISPLRIEPPIICPEDKKIKFTLNFYNPLKKDLNWEINFLKERISGNFNGNESVSLDLRIPNLPDGAYPVRVKAAGFSSSAIVPVCSEGAVISYRLDVNRDGFEECIIENNYLRVVILPHLGARIGELHYKPSGHNKFAPSLEYKRDEYIEFGGSDDRIGDKSPEMWNGEFKKKKETPASFVYTYESKGMKVTKEVKLFSSMPIVYQRLTFDVKKKKEILYYHKLPLLVGERPSKSRLYIPTNEKLETVRHTEPYGSPFFFDIPKEYYGLETGWFLVDNEDIKEQFAYVTNPQTITLTRVRFEPGFLIIEPQRKRVELKKDKRVAYSSIYVLGSGYFVQNGVLGITAKSRGRIYVFIKSSRGYSSSSVELSCRGKKRRIELKSKDIKGIGTIYTAQADIDEKEEMYVDVVLDGKKYHFKE